MDLLTLEKDALQDLDQVNTLSDLDAVYTKYLGRKEGQLTQTLRGLGSLPPEEKKRIGQAANILKKKLEDIISQKQKSLKTSELAQSLQSSKLDLTLSGTPITQGTSHPINSAINDITAIFRKLGYDWR